MLTVFTTVGVAAMLTPGLFVWGEFVTVPEEATDFEAVGKQWHWSFRLPGEDNQLGNSDVRYMTRRQPARRRSRGSDGQDDVIIARSDAAPPRESTREGAAALDRRAARLRGGAVPREDGSRAGTRDVSMVHADGGRHVRDSLRGALRRRPLRDARQDCRRRAGRLSHVARDAADVRRRRRRDRSATRRPAPRTMRSARRVTASRARAINSSMRRSSRARTTGTSAGSCATISTGVRGADARATPSARRWRRCRRRLRTRPRART